MTRRTTQLRATFELGSEHLRVMWVVTAPTVLAELIDDAQPELAEMLAEHHLQATSVRWLSLYGEDGVWLRADVLAEPWEPATR